MLTKECDVIIVGGGVVGSSIFAQLACHQDITTVLIEKSEFGKSGATARSGGMIRSYHRDSVLSDLAIESFDHYLNFQKRYSGTCDFQQTGILAFESKDNMAEVKVEVERINSINPVLSVLSNPNDSGHLYPFRTNDADLVIYESRAGYADPIKTTESWIRYGKKKGGTALEGIALKDLEVECGKIIGIRTTLSSIKAKIVVLAAGAWSKAILDPIEPISSFRTKTIQMSSYSVPSDSSPLLPFVDFTSGLYGRPLAPNEDSIGLPVNQWDINPEQEEFIDISEAVKTDCQYRLRLNRSESVFLGGKRCFDLYTENGRGICRFSENIRGLYLCTGWSGGGFKVAPALGRIVTEHIVDVIRKDEVHHGK